MIVRILLVAAGVVVASACSSGGGDVPSDQALVPGSAPEQWEVATFEGVSVATPGGWEESTSQEPEYDATMYNLQTDRNEFGTRGGVQVMTVGSPARSSQESVDAIETGYGATFGVADVEKEEIEWPGAETAWFLDFVAEAVPNDDGERAPHRVQVLVADLDDTQVHVYVTALADEFAELQMPDVLASVALE